jgi:transposase
VSTVDSSEASLTRKFAVLFPHLDERQRRLLMGAEAQVLGHGGIRLVARSAGVGEATVARGVRDLADGGDPLGRVRRPGAGRKRLTEVNPLLRMALLALVEPDERGDPMSPLRWTIKSTRRLATELTAQGHRIGADTVADLLRAEGFSLQGNAKTVEGTQHPDRDAQFRYLNETARSFQTDGQPVISVDTKKKELVGQFANAGTQWRPAGDPVKVNVHDFPSDGGGTAVPYGIYDTTANTGWVNVGTDHDTAMFAVASIRRWWQTEGVRVYPHATRLLISADAGGSNGYRSRAWKTELAALAADTALAITVCHLPPGTSKWNKIEHRLFCHITMNWSGRPLTSHEVVVNLIAATTTRTGLRVHAELDTGTYPTGIRISDAQMAALPVTRHTFHGDWNYTLHPENTDHNTETAADPTPVTATDLETLSHPSLTGMSRHDLKTLTTTLQALHHTRIETAPRALRLDGHPHAPRHGRPRHLTYTHRVLATILHLRLSLPHDTLAHLFSCSRSTIRRVIAETRKDLNTNETTIQPNPNPAPLTGLLTKIQTAI